MRDGVATSQRISRLNDALAAHYQLLHRRGHRLGITTEFTEASAF